MPDRTSSPWVKSGGEVVDRTVPHRPKKLADIRSTRQVNTKIAQIQMDAVNVAIVIDEVCNTEYSHFILKSSSIDKK